MGDKYFAGARQLAKSQMAFELPDGKGTFIINDADIKEITDKMWCDFLLEKPEHVLMIRDTGLERARLLYQVFQKEKSMMTEKMQQDCLKSIIIFLTDNNYELTTLKEEINKQTKP